MWKGVHVFLKITPKIVLKCQDMFLRDPRNRKTLAMSKYELLNQYFQYMQLLLAYEKHRLKISSAS